METSTLSNLVINSTAAAQTTNPAVTFRYFGVAVALYAIIIGSVGNLLTILAFASNKKLQTTFNVFVVNLSIVDFLTASLMLPFNLAGYVQMKWPFGNNDTTARFQAFFYFCCGYTSVVFLVAITINRFVGVFGALRYDELFNRKRMIWILVFCWTLAPICMLPFLVGIDPYCKNINHSLTGFHSKQFLCTFICLPPVGWEPYMMFTRIVFQFLPLFIMVFAYLAIFYKLRRKAKKLERTMTLGMRSSSIASTAPLSVRNSPRSTSTNSRQSETRSTINKKPGMVRRKSNVANIRAKSNRRMLMISVAICAGFMVTFLPSVIVNLLPGRRGFDVRVHMLASNFAWFNSSINPVVYVFLNPRFRKEYFRLIMMLFGRVKGKFIHDSNSFAGKSKANASQAAVGASSSSAGKNNRIQREDSITASNHCK